MGYTKYITMLLVFSSYISISSAEESNPHQRNNLSAALKNFMTFTETSTQLAAGMQTSDTKKKVILQLCKPYMKIQNSLHNR